MTPRIRRRSVQHRSADRPNPIGLHEVEVLSIEGEYVLVRALEAIDGTPIIDGKPVLDGA
jgi:tRNA (Thr-GGU) A37 N-methylase